jgi:hypothetical protein
MSHENVSVLKDRYLRSYLEYDTRNLRRDRLHVEVERMRTPHGAEAVRTLQATQFIRRSSQARL